MDSELAAMSYVARKLWSGIRTLWRNSPSSSSSDEVQALKTLMEKKDNGQDQEGSCFMSRLF